MREHPILHNSGVVLSYVSLSFLLPVVIALVYKEYEAIKPFVLIFGLAFVSGILLKMFKAEKEITLKEGLITVAFLWLLITLLGTIPFVYLLKIGFLDAFFESMSSWTTTGFSVLNPESIPKTLVFWRSLGQWLGGLGVVVLALGGLFRTGTGLYIAEGRAERIRPNILNTIKTIWWIYGLYTLLGIIFLNIAGMPIFDALNHAMTAIATGGMSTKENGIAAFGSLSIEIVLIVLMILGNISFLMHYSLLVGERKKFFKNVEVLTLFVLIIIGTLLLLPKHFLREGLFHVVSAISTGFNTVDIAAWDGYSKFLLIILMIFGGCMGSTGGGLKLIRIDIFLHSIVNTIRKFFNPRIVLSKKVGGVIYEEDVINSMFKFMGLYVLFLLISSCVLMYIGYSPIDSIFQVASAQGNVGLSVIPNLDAVSKSFLIFNMLIGRLEIWAILVFIAYLIKRR